MFVVDATIVLPHAPHVVSRVVERLHALPSWCAGLRRVRRPTVGASDAGCVFSYAAADVRLTLVARTLARGPGAPVEHAAHGEGVGLTWTLAVEPGAPPEPAHTRLRARTGLVLDPDHHAAPVRAAIYRQLARRVPADLERLRQLLERYEHGK